MKIVIGDEFKLNRESDKTDWKIIVTPQRYDEVWTVDKILSKKEFIPQINTIVLKNKVDSEWRVSQQFFNIHFYKNIVTNWKDFIKNE